MKVLNLITSAGIGGIETLLREIMNYDEIDNRICTLFNEGEIYEELIKKGKKVFSLADKNKNKKIIVKEIVDYCLTENIDIITMHNAGINSNMIYIMLKKKLPNVKFVRYFHSSFDKYWGGNNKIKRILVKQVTQKAIDNSDLLIFISKAVEKSMRENFKIKNVKTCLVYNGISNRFINNVNDEKNRENNIIYIGRLVYAKGVNILIEAFKEVYENDSNSRLIIVGDGEERENLETLAHDLKLENAVEFVGNQNNVIEWLDKAGIFVYPSIWEEGFGISVIEAMARGCIPITFKKGGLVEIIKNGENGYLVSKIGSKELAKTIQKTIKLDPKQRKKIIEEAKSTAKKFTIEETISSQKKAYESII